MSKTDKPLESPTLKQKFYDDLYVEHYVNNPKAGRCNALRKAGYEGEYITQEASRIHKRCQQRIKDIFTSRIANLDGAAYQQLQSILDSNVGTVGYNNMLSAIQKGMDYSGRKAAEVIINKTETIDDLDSANSLLLKKIALEEGKSISQVITELENPSTNTQH